MDSEFESKTHLLAILDNMPYMAWYKDIQGRFMAVNQPFADGCGKSKEEIINKTDFDIWPYELAEQYVRDDAEVMKTLKDKSIEEKIDDKTGGIWFETFKSPVFDNDRNLIGTMGMSKDISKRKNFQIELENQKRFMKSMIDAIPDFIFFKDINSTYIGCNQAFSDKFIGLNEREIIGKTDVDFIRDLELAKFFRQKDIEVFTQDKTQINEETIQLVDGKFIDVETSKTPFYNEKCEVAGLIGIARDITIRKNFEKKLKAQNDYSEMLLRTIPSAVYSIDNNKRITSWNDKAKKITGYTAEEVMGKNIESFHFHPCRDNCELCYNEIITPKSNITCKIRNKNGELRYILKNIDVLRNELDEFVGTIECFDDITENVLVENQLKESQRSLNLATSNGKVGIWDWNIQTGESVLNEQWANITGYTLEELEPLSIKTSNALTHPEDFEKSKALLKKYFEGKSDYYENEIRLKHKDGQWIWVIDRGRVIEWDSEKKPVRMVGTHIDITERKRTEEELKKNEKIISAVAMSIKALIENQSYLEAIDKCFELIGNATMVDRVYLFINNYDDEGNGYMSQMVEWNSGLVEPQKDNLKNVPFANLQSLIAPLIDKKPYYGIVKELKNDSTRKLLESHDILSVVVLPIYVNDVFWGFMGFDECKYERTWTESEFSTLSAFAHSIEKTVERRLIGEELEASKQKAEAANTMKSEFIANISHEFRTPLHAILGYASLLKDMSENNQSIVYLNAIEKSGDTLIGLIDDILDISKIESGKLELKTVYVDIKNLFDDIRNIFSLKLEEKNVGLHMKIDENIPKLLLMDEIRIRQVLFNLVGNAVKFTEEGSIKVSVVVRNYDSKNRKLDLVFEVKDTGIGIPEDQHLSIFEPFKQKDGQNTKSYGGTGLGLSISKRLIDLMGGSISLISKLGKGSTFVVDIPSISISNTAPKTDTRTSELITSKNSKIVSLEKDLNKKDVDIQPVNPEMIEKMELLKQELWLECTNKNRVNDIKKLAGFILEIGSEFNHEKTIEYANCLQSYINAFDLKNTRELLKQYPIILEHYKSNTNTGGI